VTAANAGRGSGVYGAMYARTSTSPPAGPAPPVASDPGEPAPPLPVSRSPHDFTEFYRAAWPGIARALSLALGDRDLAVEATDEAMARAYARWAKLSGYDNPAGWVYRVGLNWARSRHRRLARRLPFATREDSAPLPVPDPAVRDALMSLPLSLRSVVVCRLLLDWSVADTATALGVRPGTVQSRLHRAVRDLEASLHHLR
jgi:DNA-directed RNA polymerase specialized sigma24 family protein